MDDVMKKVENLLFSEEDETEEPEREETKQPEPVVKYERYEKPEKPERYEKQEKREIKSDFIEIFFDGQIKMSGAEIKTVPGCEIETGRLRFVFGNGSVKVYGA